jgi:RNA polymerase sigma-70 factor, ECF subfamily
VPIPDRPPASLGPAEASLDELVERVRRGDEAALEELHGVIAKGIRFFLSRELGAENLEERVDLTFRVVVQTLRRDDAGGSDRLMGHVLDAIRAQVAAHIGKSPDRDANPQQTAAFRRQLESMRGILRAMSPRDREILRRFYLDEQTEEKICREMELNPVQFKLLKLRAAARFVKAAGEERGDASCKSA